MAACGGGTFPSAPGAGSKSTEGSRAGDGGRCVRKGGRRGALCLTGSKEQGEASDCGLALTRTTADSRCCLPRPEGPRPASPAPHPAERGQGRTSPTPHPSSPVVRAIPMPPSRCAPNDHLKPIHPNTFRAAIPFAPTEHYPQERKPSPFPRAPNSPQVHRFLDLLLKRGLAISTVDQVARREESDRTNLNATCRGPELDHGRKGG